jgi:hypothetical protein
MQRSHGDFDMSTSNEAGGIPPKSATYLLRIEGLVALVAAVAAYQAIGGNWWLFALLILAPDLSMLGALAGMKTGVRIYNLAHTYTVPALLAALGWATGVAWLLPVALIWAAHIGLDRAIGYGLKYPADFHMTHLGVMGKHKEAESLADAR